VPASERKALKTASRKSPKTRDSEYGPSWPVNLAECEAAVCDQDEYVFRVVPRFVDSIIEATVKRVLAEGQEQTVDFLCKKGCPRRRLLYLVGMCENRGVTNAYSMTSYRSQELRRKLKAIKKCSKIVSRLNGHDVPAKWGGTEFAKFLGMAEVNTDGANAIAVFLKLPTFLDEYSALVEHAVLYLGGKSDFYLNLAKILVVDFVQKYTKANHDRWTADLLSITCGLEYGESEHRVWRNAYSKRFKNYRPDPADSATLRAKKTLLECEAAVFYRMDVLLPSPQNIRDNRITVSRES